MRLKRWVIYRIELEPPPYDFVSKVTTTFTKRGAHAKRKKLTKTVPKTLDPANIYQQVLEVDHYYIVGSVPRRRRLRNIKV